MTEPIPGLDVDLAKAEKLLKWAVLCLAAMTVILIIDLQLKRSVAEQAVRASGLYAKVVSEYGQAGDPGGDSGAGGGADPVDGNPGMAAGDSPAGGQAEASRARSQGGPVQRSPRNGRRASGPGG